MATFDTYLVWGVALLVIAVALVATVFMRRYGRKRGHKEDDALQTLGTTLVVLGIIFGEDQLIGYSFIGVGVILSVVSVITRRRRPSHD